jgi:hypothetical protein
MDMQKFEHQAVVFINEMGELVQRLSMDVQGHDVQILRFDGDDDNLLVKVDSSMSRMNAGQVDSFILGRLRG